MIPIALAYALLTLQGQCFRYTPHVVRLEGTLVTSVRYGPPNYGENSATDMRIRIWLLELSKPIRMCADTVGSALDDVRQVEVFFDRSPARYRGMRVEIRGTLEQATLGPQFTPVVMYARGIQKSDADATQRSTGPRDAVRHPRQPTPLLGVATQLNATRSIRNPPSSSGGSMLRLPKRNPPCATPPDPSTSA